MRGRLSLQAGCESAGVDSSALDINCLADFWSSPVRMTIRRLWSSP
jgi:hypothetical protein